MKNTTSAILAGGKSSRFGSPKINARIGEHTLLEKMLQIARHISPNAMLISGRNNLALSPVTPVYPDLIPDCGPLGGIYTALYYSSLPYVCILPCDMPLLKPAIYSILCHYISDNAPVVAVSGKGIEPLVSVWPKKLLPIIHDEILGGNFPIKETLQKLQATRVDIKNHLTEYSQDIFRNINFQSDLQYIQNTGELYGS